MRNSDGRNAAQIADGVDGWLVEKSQAIPEHIAPRRLQQESPLTDREVRLGVNGIQISFLLLDDIVMFSRKLLERRPLLPVKADELAGILANRTFRWRLDRRLCSSRSRLTQTRDRAAGVWPGVAAICYVGCHVHQTSVTRRLCRDLLSSRFSIG
jgi:hypothetical protein